METALLASKEVVLNLVERSFRVEGPGGLGAKPRPEIIGPLLTSLPHALLDAVRMGFLHSSRACGRVPASLKASAEVRFVGMEGAGDTATLLHFHVPPFGSAARELFQQQRLWDDGPQPDETAFELFGAALNDVAARRENSDRFDPGLLRRISRYNRVLRLGVDRITLPDARLADPSRVDAQIVRAAADLAAITPQPRRVRVAGRLDVMGASQGVLKVEVSHGELITAIWEGEDSLKDFFNRDVVVEGLGVFRPSGTLLRIDADAVVPASSRDDFFRRVPTAPVVRDYQKLVRLRPGEKSVYAQFLGSIPAEESDGEFATAIDELS